jgi:hypothetical protein
MLLLGCVLPAKRHIDEVEPREFEPLSSAVQSQNPIVVDVRSCSKYRKTWQAAAT